MIPPTILRTTIAGIEATAHLIIKITIDIKGILTSVIRTFELSIKIPPEWKNKDISQIEKSGSEADYELSSRIIE